MTSPHLTSPRRRAVSTAVVAAAITGAAGAPALAADAKFLAYVKGSQQTTWNEPSHLVRVDCSSHDYKQSHGGESITWHSRRPEVLHLTTLGETALVTYGAPGDTDRLETGLATKATVARSLVIQDHRETSTCTKDLQQPTPPPNDCGTRHPEWSATLQLTRGKVQLSFTDALLAPLTPQTFSSCDLDVPLVTALDGTGPGQGKPATIAGRIDPAALARLKPGKTKVITANDHWSEVHDGPFDAHVSTAQTSRWQIRLLRLKGR